MVSLMKGEMQAFLEENRGIRNGYYERDIGTRYGKIDNLRVPRDRNSQFRSALFEPYQRNIGIELLSPCIPREFQQGRWQRYSRKYSTAGTANQPYRGSQR